MYARLSSEQRPSGMPRDDDEMGAVVRVDSPHAAVDSPTAVLVLGTADWSQPIATNQHYVTRELASAPGVEITFVESLALRAPELSRRDLARIVRRVRSAVRRSGGADTRSSRPVPPGTSIVSPLVAPAAWRWSHRANATLLRRSVAAWRAHPGPKVLWTYTPVTYGLERCADAVVYHCVDLLGQFEGIDVALIDHHEQRVASAGAQAIASSDVVRRHLTERGFGSPLLWENVADTEVFSSALDGGPSRTPRRAIFAGNLTPKKVDYATLVALAGAGWEVAVAGPRAEGGGADDDDFARLVDAGVEHLGMLSPSQLAAEMARSTLGLIPYVDTAYTRGVSPLKTFEYLAAGLAVLSSALPGVTEVPGMVEVVQPDESFVDRAEAFAAPPAPAQVAARVAHAERHSWRRRGGEARALLARLGDTGTATDGTRPPEGT